MLFHELEQYDLEAVRSLIKKELEDSLRPRTQALRKGNKSKNLINKELSVQEKLRDTKDQKMI